MAFVSFLREFSPALGFSHFNIISAENSRVLASSEEPPQLGTEPDLRGIGLRIGVPLEPRYVEPRFV